MRRNDDNDDFVVPGKGMDGAFMDVNHVAAQNRA